LTVDCLVSIYVLLDGFRQKFRVCRPVLGETFMQFSVKLSSYFTRWLEMAKTNKDFESCALILHDQFRHVCNKDLRTNS